MFEGQLLYKFTIYWDLYPKKKLYYEPALILKYQSGYYTALLNDGVKTLRTIEFLSESELNCFKQLNDTEILPYNKIIK